MFICEKCVPKGMFFVAVSYGCCEDCNKAAACADIPCSELNAFEKKSKKKSKTRSKKTKKVK